MKPDTLEGPEEHVWDLVEERPRPGRHAARSAIWHVERAQRIRDIDPTMAMFRLVTAEEEASRAIFHSLHRLQYENASRLSWKSHRHKFALLPFLAAIQEMAKSEGAGMNLQIVFDGESPRVRFKIPFPDGPRWAYPNPPLHFRLEIDDKLHDFRPDMERLLEEDQVESFIGLVRDRAALRTRLLYATDQGVPRVEVLKDETLKQYRESVFAILTGFLLIDCYPKQPLVQQALDGFLRLMELLPEVDFESPS